MLFINKILIKKKSSKILNKFYNLKINNNNNNNSKNLYSLNNNKIQIKNQKFKINLMII